MSLEVRHKSECPDCGALLGYHDAAAEATEFQVNRAEYHGAEYCKLRRAGKLPETHIPKDSKSKELSNAGRRRKAQAKEGVEDPV